MIHAMGEFFKLILEAAENQVEVQKHKNSKFRIIGLLQK